MAEKCIVPINDILDDCTYSYAPGIDSMLVTNFDNVATVTATNNVITAFTLDSSAAASVWMPDWDNSSETDTYTPITKKSGYFANVLTVAFEGVRKDVTVQFNTITKGKLAICLKYNDGTAVYFNGVNPNIVGDKGEPAYITSIVKTVPGSTTEASNITATLTSNAASMSYPMDVSIYNTLYTAALA